MAAAGDWRREDESDGGGRTRAVSTAALCVAYVPSASTAGRFDCAIEIPEVSVSGVAASC